MYLRFGWVMHRCERLVMPPVPEDIFVQVALLVQKHFLASTRVQILT
jgi:hypothetical protein